MSKLQALRRRTSLSTEERPPFPTQQLFILALCRICEPIAFMSIFPYIYYMISSFHITQDDRQIAIYAGMVTSSFAFAEFSTGVIWGRLSDRVGRKPILLTGLAGTGLSMLVFGFAKSLPVALLARALGGLLNGNIGVLQTTVAEVVTIKEHQPRAYAVMPFVWCLGSIIGCSLGGSLADPVKSYPSLFAPGTIFETYPYLLPNLVCAAVVLVGLIIGILFLEETHEGKKQRQDPGLRLGQMILGKAGFGKLSANPVFTKQGDANLEEVQPLLDRDVDPPGYRTIEGSPLIVARASAQTPEPPHHSLEEDLIGVKPKASISGAFTKQVILHITAYGILAYHTISFEQLMPVLLSMPESDAPRSLPFKFTGGFALSTKTIGFILSLQGIYQMAVQLLLFPVIIRRFGALATFRAVIFTYPVLYLLVPYLALLPSDMRMAGVYAVLMWKVTAQALAYPSNALLLTNSAPSMLVLGAINGVAASAASLCRAFGPTVAGLIQSAGLRMGYSGLAWWASSLVCVAGAVECSFMREVRGRLDQEPHSTELGNKAASDMPAVPYMDDQIPTGRMIDPATKASVQEPREQVRVSAELPVQYDDKNMEARICT